MLQISCSYFYSKEKYLRDYEQFVSRIEAQSDNFTPAQWDEAQFRYDEFNTELYQRVYADLTPADQQAIGRLKARYTKVQLKYEFNKLLDGVKDGVEQLKGAVEEME
jgi:phosphoglycolate phosphatase-like HAD superfamily hydrolase